MKHHDGRSSISGLLFNIMRFSIHDGPGLRTTIFFKGCPLHCGWCHNPEGLDRDTQLVHRPDRCIACAECREACPAEAINIHDGAITRLPARCRLCGACVEACSTESLRLIGKRMTVTEVMDEILKDRSFYEESKGGITCSGGEPLSQSDFLEAVLSACKSEEIHTALDTSGAAPFELFERILPHLDLILYDLKLMDEERHEHETGVSNREILENLRRLSDGDQEIIVRIPVVPGFNDSNENIVVAGAFLASLPRLPEVHLLPYHQAGEEKLKLLPSDEEDRRRKRLTRSRLLEIKEALRTYDLTVQIGA